MNPALYDRLAKQARDQYNAAYSIGYRQSDDKGLGSPTHADYENLVTAVSSAFNRPIDVLDLGCGTGRYFHCLRNVKSLTGVDISPDMLVQAKQPVGPPLTFAPQLLCSNLSEVTFGPCSFDLIYSIGVLGEFMPFDSYLCRRIASWLRPGGTFAFSVIDKASQRQTSWKRQLALNTYRLLPKSLKVLVTARTKALGLDERELRTILTPHFQAATVTQRRHSPNGRWHLVCIATV
jgi:SAM-dependent methyltransferase